MVEQSADAVFTVPMQSGRTYLIEPSDNTSTELPFAPVSGAPANEPKKLGSRTIGVETQSAIGRSRPQ